MEGVENMNDIITISIIVPIYNVEKYVRQCIESIINQTYKNLQIILVDDGSTDTSGLICDEYASIDDRIEVVHKKNGGLVTARKIGLQKAKGEYIGFVDGDDYIDDNMYESLLGYILKQDVDMVHTGYWYEKGNATYSNTNFETGFIECPEDKSMLLRNILVQHTNIEHSIWSKLFKRALIVKSYYDVNDECSYGEDLVCMISAIINSDRMYILNRAYYHYRVRSESLSHGMGLGGISKEIKLYNNIQGVLIKYKIDNYYEKELDFYFGNQIVMHMSNISSDPFAFQQYCFSDIALLKNKNIIIYGAGKVGRDYYSQLRRYSNCNIVAWIDKKADKINYPNIDIYNPAIIKSLEYDIIVIAVARKEVYEQIKMELIDMKVDSEKILWIAPGNCKYYINE